MTRSRSRPMALLCGLVLCALPACTYERPTSTILGEIHAWKPPEEPKEAGDRLAASMFLLQKQEANERLASLAEELSQADPDNPELRELLPWRWTYRAGSAETNKGVRAEIQSVLARSKDPMMIASCHYALGVLAIMDAGPDPQPASALPAIEGFRKLYPADPRGAVLLMGLAARVKDFDEKERLFARIEKDYPTSRTAQDLDGERRKAEIQRHQAARLGKPFELEFTDAISGKSITMAALKGKVVVVDFWATWCPPCVESMPKLKSLYAKYKDQGVEFIGISLDRSPLEGGLDQLKEFVARNDIPWPQHYEGKYWDSRVAANWEVSSLPTMFLVDADGKLASVEAREDLESLIRAALEKAKGKSVATLTSPAP